MCVGDKMKKYMKRIIDDVLIEELEAFGGVLIAGPKWCGKTTSASQLANSSLFMHDEDSRESNIQLAKTKPSILLRGESPRLIDEWQIAPELWDAIRFDIDNKGKEGLFILTGSTIVDESKIMHSGAGRISRLLMRTMSLYESGDSNGTISLLELFNDKKELSAQADIDIEDMAKILVRGGWPNSIEKKMKIAIRQISGYCDAIVNSEIKTVDGVNRDPNKTRSILKVFSRHVSTQAAYTTMLKDLKSNNETININTMKSYIDALEKLYVIEDLPAWSPKLRSKTAVRTSPTRHFIDPAIAARMMDAYPEDLLNDLNTFGLLFESLVIRDLRIYSQLLNGKVYHYRDKTNLEVDAIIHLDNGKWGAIEVKLGSSQIDKAAENLIKFKEKVDLKQGPSFLAVITTTKYAFKRVDGVLVIPIGCLKP